MDGGSCYIVVEGEITCHESDDDDYAFQVLKSRSLSLGCNGPKSISVRHFEDDAEEHVLEWRRRTKTTQH